MTPAIALLVAALLAQPADPPPAAPTTTFQVRSVPREQRAPILYEAGDFILFKAVIAGREVWAALDTGAEASVIDVGLAREAGLTVRSRAGKVRTPSGEVAAWEAIDAPILLPGQFETRHPNIPAIDLSAVPGVGDRKIGFVLGQDFLRPTVLLVDPALRTFQLGPAGAFRPPPGVPALDLAPGRPQVTATLGGQPVRLNLDTGFRGELSVTAAAWDRLVPKDAAVETTTTQDIAGRARPARRAQRPDFKLGPLRIPTVTVQDTPAILTDADGEVGMGVLSRFRFALDLTAGKLWMAPLGEGPAGAPPAGK